ncbi:Non-reducing end beta-L-arabinofuranosidase [Planctomycetes bacterium CA13]|uniref:Non-reducing end beta-L-arabinofuranosidase n=1 Tax=Novipirellula herctigrandis TaxID=2527986 RepID=A0A5C5Z9W2_9BACT|nr:Non-reducing end beta-L-arabinofuranosidase [Planctomycetes bacterium CA13]
MRRLTSNHALSVVALSVLVPALTLTMMLTQTTSATAASPTVRQEAQMFPLSSVRVLDGYFSAAVAANRSYLLAHDPDRLLSPFLREAGLEPKAPSYGNWEGSGLDGHTAGHYLSALAFMIASGSDTPDGEFRKRLDYMLAELEHCQRASGDGYIGGVPGSRELWREVSSGHIDAHGFGINGKWVPWYNLHKTFAGLRDAYLVAGSEKAREILVRYGKWCTHLVSNLDEDQMQNMLRAEHGGMNEVMADIFAITKDEEFLGVARRFNHKEVLDPLLAKIDRLTGMHANTQIPKVIGLERIAALSGDEKVHVGARFFWETVTQHRSVAFGGNSVSEHFNDPHDFSRVVEHREGPETCNTYNMLRLTEQLFASEPQAAYADYYERALYNHILAAINPRTAGYVYFTPLRPDHYRVYSQPEQAFWCCVGSGMENPGKYGQFIYARGKDGIYVNLFIASELTVSDNVTLHQETAFPDEPRTRLCMTLKEPSTFTLHLRHPVWANEGDFVVHVNGKPIVISSQPSSYVEIRREWKDGDVVDVELPMRTTVEPLPDGSLWSAIMHGPILLAAPSETQDLVGLRADDSRMGHIANGPLTPLDRVPVLIGTDENVSAHVKPDVEAGPMHFRIMDIVEPDDAEGVKLVPFYRLHDSRYQMYWQVTTEERYKERRERLAAQEHAKAAFLSATLDSVAIGEQQPEVEHQFVGEGTETGVHQGRRWRHGEWFQYTLNTKGEQKVDLVVTYWGGDSGRRFDILANQNPLASVELSGTEPDQFMVKRYSIPTSLLNAAPDGQLTIKFVATQWVAGGIYDVRLMKPDVAIKP